VVRYSKHGAKATNFVVPEQAELDDHGALSDIQQKAKQWMILLSYHKIMDMAMTRFEDLKTRASEPFLDGMYL
jgi:hypothetical protein